MHGEGAQGHRGQGEVSRPLRQLLHDEDDYLVVHSAPGGIKQQGGQCLLLTSPFPNPPRSNKWIGRAKEGREGGGKKKEKSS